MARFFWWNAVPPFNPIGNRGWQPSYPDFASSQEFRTAALTTCVWVSPLSPPATATISGTVSGTVIPAPLLLQYQDYAAPLTTTAEFDTTNWWRGWYPDRIDPLTGLPVANQLASALPPFIPQDQQWRPWYPDKIDPSPSLQTSAQQAFTLPAFQTFTDLRWEATYPDRIDRLTFTAERQQAIATGQTGSTIPIEDVRWASVYPDWIARQTVGAEQQRATWLDPFPIAPATQLQAWAIGPDWLVHLPTPNLPFVLEPFPRPTEVTQPFLSYPDAVGRVTLPTAAQMASVLSLHATIPITDLRWQSIFPDQVFRAMMLAAQQMWEGPMNFIPIPNPPTAAVLDDKTPLGTADGARVTVNPTIGWPGW